MSTLNDGIDRSIADAALKFYGRPGIESPKMSSSIPLNIETGLNPLLNVLRAVRSDATLVAYGSRTPNVGSADKIGDYARGDHLRLSTMFHDDRTLTLMANTLQDSKNSLISGSCEVSNTTSVVGKPNNSLLLTIVTPKGLLYTPRGDYRSAGENGSVYLAVNYTNKKPTPQEWLMLTELVSSLHKMGKSNLYIRGGLFDFKKGKVPLAFLMESGKKNVIHQCDDNARNNRTVDLRQLLANLEQAYNMGEEDLVFYLGGTLDL